MAFVIVNEAGASVYSTSLLGREEFPNYDATLRGAISIGRRLQDPLSELVKIDPASIGVGLYQHDVKAKHLQPPWTKWSNRASTTWAWTSTPPVPPCCATCRA